MKGTPAFQLYPKDLLADPNVEQMTNEQLGMYLRLMCWEWINGGLPLDDEAIKRLARAGDNWSSERCLLLQCFKKTETEYFHPRLKKEREKQRKFRKQRAEAGSRGGKATKRKRLEQETGEQQESSEKAASAAADLAAKSTFAVCSLPLKETTNRKSIDTPSEGQDPNNLSDPPPAIPEPSARIQNSMLRVCGGIVPNQLLRAIEAHGELRVQAAFDKTEESKPGQTVNWNYVAAILLNWGKNGLPRPPQAAPRQPDNDWEYEEDGSRKQTSVPFYGLREGEEPGEFQQEQG